MNGRGQKAADQLQENIVPAHKMVPAKPPKPPKPQLDPVTVANMSRARSLQQNFPDMKGIPNEVTKQEMKKLKDKHLEDIALTIDAESRQNNAKESATIASGRSGKTAAVKVETLDAQYQSRSKLTPVNAPLGTTRYTPIAID